MKLSTRVAAGACVLVVSVAAGIGAIGEILSERRSDMLLEVQAKNAQAIVYSALDLSIGRLEPHVRTIGRDRDASKALTDGDTAALTESMISTYNRVAATGDMTHLTFYDLSGRIVARFPEGAPGGDRPVIAAQAQESRKRHTGVIELEPGVIGGALAAPILKGRNAVGSVVLGISARGQLQRIADLLGVEAVLYEGADIGARSNGFAEDLDVRHLAAGAGLTSSFAEIGDAVQIMTRMPISNDEGLQRYAQKLVTTVIRRQLEVA